MWAPCVNSAVAVRPKNSMPIKSKAQERLMQGVAHSPEFAKKVGIKPSVGKEFVKAGPAKKNLPERVKKGK